MGDDRIGDGVIGDDAINRELSPPGDAHPDDKTPVDAVDHPVVDGVDNPFDELQPLWIDDPDIIPTAKLSERRWVRPGVTALVALAVIAAIGGLVFALASDDDNGDTTAATDAEVLGASEVNEPAVEPPLATPLPEPTALQAPTPEPSPTPTLDPQALLYKSVVDAGIAMDQLTLVDAYAPATGYTDYLAGGWADTDGDCITTRHDVLAATSLDPVEWSADGCTVTAGRWVDAWSGAEVTAVDDAVVAPVVPLRHAHDAGGWRWDTDGVTAFANDDHPRALRVVSRSTAGTIDPSGVTVWRPASRPAWCAFAIDWIDTKTRWQLETTEGEREALGEMIASCLEPESDGPPR